MKKVLIIEDDGDTVDMLSVITKQANFEVVLRSDVLPLSEIEQIDPDLILLDHWIGNHSGGGRCLEIKNNTPTAAIIVIMLSALPDIGQIAIENCADGSLSKPFDVEEVVDVMRSYL